MSFTGRGKSEMIKRTFKVDYTIRPNKKAQGRPFSRNMTMAKRDDGKLIYTLAALHRVNRDAVCLDAVTHTATKLMLLDWLRNRFRSLLRSAA